MKQERSLAWENNLEERVLAVWRNTIDAAARNLGIIQVIVFVILSIPFLLLYKSISKHIDESYEKLISYNDAWDSPRLSNFIDKNDPKSIDALKELLSKEYPRLRKTKIKDNLKWRQLILWTNLYLSETANIHTEEYRASNWVLFHVWKFQDFQEKKDFIMSYMYNDIKLWYAKINEMWNITSRYGIQAAFVILDILLYDMIIKDVFPFNFIISLPFLYIGFISYKNIKVLNSHPDIRESIKRYHIFEWDHEDVFLGKHDRTRHKAKYDYLRKGMKTEAERLYDFIQLK